MDRDDADERQVRIDTLMQQVRTKLERTRELAEAARKQTRKAGEAVRSKIRRVRQPGERRKKAG